ncbi:site-specific recombinase XerD [Enterococcus rivorum]|nr:site-specific recombinase XerD [Enterococcus rivorum]
MTKEYVNNKIKKYTRKAGIEKNMSSHKFRHTHVSLMAEAGVSLPVIQKRVGHSDRILTEEIYLHITSDMNIDSVFLLDELLKNKSWSNEGHK